MRELGPWIETASGGEFYPYAPEFKIEDIAHALGNICRFGGHCREFYSVAEHSVRVSILMEQLGTGDPFEGLLHDACEAYTGDKVAPFKPLFPDFVLFEKRIDGAVRKWFGLPVEKSRECKRADQLLQFAEAAVMMHSRGVDWVDPDNLRVGAVNLGICFAYWAPKIAAAQFLSRYYKLWPKHSAKIREHAARTGLGEAVDTGGCVPPITHALCGAIDPNGLGACVRPMGHAGLHRIAVIEAAQNVLDHARTVLNAASSLAGEINDAMRKINGELPP